MTTILTVGDGQLEGAIFTELFWLKDLSWSLQGLSNRAMQLSGIKTLTSTGLELQ
jgi:hypothetical protein